MSVDLKGRAYAKVSEIKQGSCVEVDGGFPCLKSDVYYNVYDDGAGLYIECDDGKHFLSGQLDETGSFYTGIYLSPVKN
jgi:hypothetical protein